MHSRGALVESALIRLLIPLCLSTLDVREAAGKVERRLRDRALQLHVMGWHEDETTEYAVAERTVIGRLRISREATP